MAKEAYRLRVVKVVKFIGSHPHVPTSMLRVPFSQFLLSCKTVNAICIIIQPPQDVVLGLAFRNVYSEATKGKDFFQDHTGSAHLLTHTHTISY